jgi:transcription-repair coupling factor (superfamily II helicase)
VNSIEQLLSLYRDGKKVQQISKILDRQGVSELDVSPAPSRIQLSGLIGSQDSFVLSGTYLNRQGHHLVIANDKEEAAYIQNDIANLIKDKSILFFPDSFKRPSYFEDIDQGNVLQRTETVNKLITSNALGEIVVTYPEALFEKVASPEALNKHRIDIAKGEKLDTDFIIQLLVEYGFEHTDFVYEPGQFSVRGGIIDIFSYGNEFPYRIELFDIEVESIRTFDPNTQLSQQHILRVSIVPNMNTRFAQSEKIPIFDILPTNTTIWLKDVQYLLDRLQNCYEKADAFAQKLTFTDSEEIKDIFRDRAFIRTHETMGSIDRLHLIVLSKGKHDLSFDLHLEFQTKPQPSFNKNFKLLINNLHENSASKLTNYLLTDNVKQMDRLFAIFKDLSAKVQCTPVYQSIHQGFIDTELQIALYTDHQIFERYHRFQLRKGFSREQALNVSLLRQLSAGDFVTHIDHGVGKFSGLEKININGSIQEAVRIVYLNNDLLYVGINSLHKIAKYVGKEGTPPRLNKLGSDTWQNLKRATKKKVKDIAQELIKLYAARRASEGFQFPEDGYLQNELEATFLYEDTPDQLKATNDVKEDMQRPYPMDRLICGDVGFGKTEVAIRAAFKAVTGGKQVAILVPTTILALQHYKTFKARLEEFAVTVDYVNRFRSAKEKKQVFEDCKIGKVDIVIGTHGLLNKEVGFKDLGLLIIDEEQKFGVTSKEKLRNLKINVDTLTLTATPIPRTLQFSLMAARDLSVMRTPPPNRQPIHTEVRVFNQELIKEVIVHEVNRGGQVFFVHNQVKSLPDMLAMVQELCPGIDVAMAHGQMESDKMEETLVAFIDKKFDVLISTNIIETGLDIANANTIIINNAHHFGMSDLHQLRGRVGRSNRKAYCYLFCPPLSILSNDAKKRLKTLEEFSDLGSGFNIAMRDLDIRGAGNLLGGEQSGFIADIGYETYQKILEEAIQELKETDFKELFREDLEKEKKYVLDVQIETDIEMLIPDEYVANTQERLSLYTNLDAIESETGIQAFANMLTDRFGKIPPQVEELFDGLRLRWIAKKLGFERIHLKGQKLQCYFVSNPQSSFYETKAFKNVLNYVLGKGKDRQMSFKQSTKSFIFIRENVRTLNGARKVLEILIEESVK